MRTFHLSDTAFTELAAGRPAPETLAELRKAQESRHLLLLSEIRRLGDRVPAWYAAPPTGPTAAALADPMAALHSAATLAALRGGTPPPPGWTAGTRHLTATHDGLTLRVRLEDTDPLRSRLGLTPFRQLTGAEAAEWQSHLTRAWHLLVTRHRPAAATMAAVLSVIVPVEPQPSAAGISATAVDAYGAVAISPPADARALAVGLLHETQHSLLNATQFLFDLVDSPVPLGYSPWRDDPRPPSGILHGAYAYQAVTRFWRTEAAAGDPESRVAAFEFARWRAAVVSAADGLLSGTALTAAGRRFTGALRDEVAAWLADAVEPGIERLAAGANHDHRARWRLANLTVAPADVEAVVRAWRAGQPAPFVPAAVVGAEPGRRLERSRRLGLVHALLRGDPGLSPGSRVRPGDAAYLGARPGTAFDAYRQELSTQSDPELWAGLSLTSPDAALQARPELVRAVYLALHGDVDVSQLAVWLG
ncbi:aKG-HExxH-type peptide beta-hydroxylase [Paractinoplanes rishiriensis]|uniref:HEXXH motif domain-containing protein n=1 Tax=Paractinoplanes rishiriensis TaxID=1050105 RepID=A0A919JV47_9ACTN|nr:HEXXH motif-containing putative peptide modification protein [Actinoplanes rishiriensis]GIE95776.1 hypothetical protein Ari01nite_32410 [Actinoplanes rishiriensis]